MKNAARKTRPVAIVIKLAPVCTCGHVGRGAHRKACATLRAALRSAQPANDTLPWLDGRHVAPELPAVRQVTVGLPVSVPPPCDMRIVVDVVRAGWCTTCKTLSYGLVRAGVAPGRVQAVVREALRLGVVSSVRGVWVLSGLVA